MKKDSLAIPLFSRSAHSEMRPSAFDTRNYVEEKLQKQRRHIPRENSEYTIFIDDDADSKWDREEWHRVASSLFRYMRCGASKQNRQKEISIFQRLSFAN